MRTGYHWIIDVQYLYPTTYSPYLDLAELCLRKVTISLETGK